MSHAAHHPVYLYMTGEWPAEFTNHDDYDKRNNRCANLRAARPAENSRNRRLRHDSKTGVRGVGSCRKTGCHQALIMADRKQRHLGYYEDLAYAS